MRAGEEWHELRNNFRVFLVWAASILMDTTFLALWVFAQWFMDEMVINTFTLSVIDSWMLLTFQVIFAVSTLAPVVAHIYADIRVIFIRAQRRVQREIELGKAKWPRH